MNFFTKFQGGAVAAVQHPTRRPWYIITFFSLHNKAKRLENHLQNFE